MTRISLATRVLSIAALALCGTAHAEPVNINTADAATLARELVGIGEARAKAIVEHRTQNGPFRSADDLALVKGIGPRVIERNRANIRVDRVGARAAPSAPATQGLARPAAAAVGAAKQPSPPPPRR